MCQAHINISRSNVIDTLLQYPFAHKVETRSDLTHQIRSIEGVPQTTTLSSRCLQHNPLFIILFPTMFNSQTLRKLSLLSC